MIKSVNNTVESPVSAIDLKFSDLPSLAHVVECFQGAAASQFAGDRKDLKELRVNQRSSLYVTVGCWYGLALQLLDEANADYTDLILEEHGLTRARQGTNPFRPFADLLFGEWVRMKDGKKPKHFTAQRKVKVTEPDPKQSVKFEVERDMVDVEVTFYFVPNRSAEKYAKVGRFAHSKGWKPAELADKMLTYPAKMGGVLKDDTNANRKTDQEEIETQELVDLIYQEKPLSTLELTDCGIGPKEAEERKLVSLWAEIRDGEVLIRGTLPTSEDALTAYVRKYAQTNSDKLLRQKIKRMGEQGAAKLRETASNGDDAEEAA